MAGFSLTKGGKTFDFDLTGEVKRNNTRIGLWATSNDDNNQIVVTEDGGAKTAFNVAWQFNKNNQLELHGDDKLLLNFHAQSGIAPEYRLDGVVLKVTPDRSKAFSFPLHAEWSLDKNFDMTAKFGATTSVIDGFIEDDRSRFVYKFFTKKGDVEKYQLVFPGSWTGKNEDGKFIMTFHYQRKGQEQIFTLPESVMFDKTINQLVFDYKKNGLDRRLQFTGELKISPKFVLTYKLDRQQSGGRELVSATTLAIQATVDMERFNSKLDVSLVLMKQDGVTPGTSLAIGGVFERDLKGSKLKLAFAYKFVKTGGQVKTNSFTLAGQLKLKDETTLVWEFSNDVAARSLTITFAADQFRLGEFTGNLQLAVSTEAGQLKEVHMLFGLSF